MTAQLSAPAIATQTWTWQGHQIHYAVQGTGQPLVLIHGFGACIGHWRKNIPVLAAAGYRVFALDLLGFGASDKPKLDYRLEIWQELLQDFWSAFIQEPAIFVGNSMGGLITLMMLANHPDISAGGVLLNSAGGLNMNMRDDEKGVLRRILMGGINTLIASKRLGPALFNRVRTKQRIRGSLSQVYRNPEAITDELVDMIHAAAATPGAQEAFASIMTAPLPRRRRMEVPPRRLGVHLQLRARPHGHHPDVALRLRERRTNQRRRTVRGRRPRLRRS